MKKLVSLLLCALALAALIGGCGSQNAKTPEEKSGPKKLKIVTTIYPLYDWTKEILGDEVENTDLTLLLRNGVDMHSYQPTAEDLVKISSCDVLIYVGGESDAWVEDAHKEAVNKNMVAIRLMDVIGDRAKREESVEGMEAHHHHDHDKDEHKHDEHKHDDHDEHELDEHIWLSLKCAMRLCKRIADNLSDIDKPNASKYQANCDSYIKRLSELDARYEKTIKGARQKTLLFADRFPFLYMAEDYGLKCYAAFSGCSAETEASFKTIAFLANKVKELKLPAIIVLEGRRHKIAETVLSTSKAKGVHILELDSLQSSTSKDAAKGKSYLGAMEKNLKAISIALNCAE